MNLQVNLWGWVQEQVQAGAGAVVLVKSGEFAGAGAGVQVKSGATEMRSLCNAFHCI